MGKAALLAITAFTLIGAYYTLGSQRGMIESADRLGGHQYEVLARNAALAGYAQARQGIADAGGFSVPAITGSFEGASYSTTVTTTDGGQAAVIRSTSQIVDGTNRPWTYDVEARVLKEQIYSISEEPPMFMRYGLIVESDLTLNGNILIDTMVVEGVEGAQNNANIHTNGKLTLKGNAATIRGFGTYVTSKDVKHERRFNPYYNPTNEPVVQRVEPVDIPNLDFDVRKVAEVLGPNEVHNGGYVLNGDVDYAAKGATRENPWVVHVKNGDLTTSGNTTVSGYVIFLVEKDIIFNGNLRMGTDHGGNESTFAFYAGRDMEMKGNPDVVNGQIFAKRNITFSGTPRIYGNLVAGGQAKLNGTPKIYYRPASAALTRMFQDAEVSFRLISYNEW